MIKKWWLLFLGIGVFYSFFLIQLDSRKTIEAQTTLVDYSQGLNQIDAKIDKILNMQGMNNKDLVAKMNTIIANQEKILNELEIVKVRSTR